MYTLLKLSFICFSRYNSVDINVAVATDSGLITPIVFRADAKVKRLIMLIGIVFCHLLKLQELEREIAPCVTTYSKWLRVNYALVI